jgi:hypothetical protein
MQALLLGYSKPAPPLGGGGRTRRIDLNQRLHTERESSRVETELRAVAQDPT